MAEERKVAVDLTYRDIGMIVRHLEQSARDGWHYGNRTHFCNRRDKLIELLESKLIAKADAALAQPEPEWYQAIAKRAIESCLAQRDEVLAAFIAKYGFQPEDVIQVEQRQPDGTSTWRIERRPGPKPEELRDEDLEATARAAENQYMKEHGGPTAPTPDGILALLQKQRLAGLRAVAARYARPVIESELGEGEVEELVRRLRDWQSIPLLEERERIATLLQQLSTITTEDLNND